LVNEPTVLFQFLNWSKSKSIYVSVLNWLLWLILILEFLQDYDPLYLLGRILILRYLGLLSPFKSVVLSLQGRCQVFVVQLLERPWLSRWLQVRDVSLGKPTQKRLSLKPQLVFIFQFYCYWFCVLIEFKGRAVDETSEIGTREPDRTARRGFVSRQWTRSPLLSWLGRNIFVVLFSWSPATCWIRLKSQCRSGVVNFTVWAYHLELIGTGKMVLVVIECLSG